MGLAIACITLFVLCGSAALLLGLRGGYVYATIAGLVSLVVAAGAGVSLQNYGRSREEEKVADARMQEAIRRVSMMVAAREAASRVAGGGGGDTSGSYDEALAHVEHELRSLGGMVPSTLEDVEEMLRELADTSAVGVAQERLADMHQRMTERRDRAGAAGDKVNVTMEADSYTALAMPTIRPVEISGVAVAFT